MTITDEPFFEHPTGEFLTAIEAMTAGIERLDALGPTEVWLVFCAQGQGSHPNAYRFFELPIRGRPIDLGKQALDPQKILEFAQCEGMDAFFDQRVVACSGATPLQFARFLDRIFRELGLQPFEDEDDDYAVGAEW